MRANIGFASVAFLILGTATVSLLLSSLSPFLRAGEGVVLGILWWGAIRGILADPVPGIAPYFERRVGDIHTYSRGKALGMLCPKLDELASTLGINPISSFGFADDFYGGTPVWHDATEGLRTFSALKQELERRGGQQDPALNEEMRLIIEALEKAAAQSIRFCLVIPACYTNGMEHEQRKGSFF